MKVGKDVHEPVADPDLEIRGEGGGGLGGDLNLLALLAFFPSVFLLYLPKIRVGAGAPGPLP